MEFSGCDNYIKVRELLSRHFGKLPILACEKIKDYHDASVFLRLGIHTLDYAHLRMLSRAVENNKRCIFLADLLEEILSCPTKFLHDMYDGRLTNWGRRWSISYSWLMNHIWPTMFNIAGDDKPQDPTCERFLAALLKRIGCSNPERMEKELSSDEEAVRRVFVSGLGIEEESEENQHKNLYKLYTFMMKRIVPNSYSWKHTNRFYNCLTKFEEEEVNKYRVELEAFDLVKFMFTYKKSPLHKYCNRKSD